MKRIINSLPVINSFYEVMASPIEKSNGQQIKVKTNFNLYPDFTQFIKVSKPQISKHPSEGIILKY